MSRLREAFEKAAGRQSGGQPETTRAPRAGDEAQLPDEWDFDLKTVEPLRSQAAAPETLEAETRVAPPPQVVRFEDVEIGGDETDMTAAARPLTPSTQARPAG